METRPYQVLEVDHADGIARLTLNRPERRNALSPQLVNELLWALDDAKDNDAVRVVILTGAAGTFCSGGDLQQMSADSPLALKGDYADLLLRFPALGKPTIARVEGYAMGGGLGLVASCDFALAAESAVLGTPEIRRGLFPMMIMSVLDRVMSRRELVRMMLLGDKLSAATAKELGLLSSVVPDPELDEAVRTLATQLAAQSPTAMSRGLLAYHHQADLALTEAVPYLRDQLHALLGTADAREGLRAFAEKRAPTWTGE